MLGCACGGVHVGIPYHMYIIIFIIGRFETVGVHALFGRARPPAERINCSNRWRSNPAVLPVRPPPIDAEDAGLSLSESPASNAALQQRLSAVFHDTYCSAGQICSSASTIMQHQALKHGASSFFDKVDKA
jgi:hypothetical protein